MAKKRYKDEDLLGPAPQPDSALKKALNVGISGLSGVANLLDLPGSMARDTVAGLSTGNWSKHNPFDQLLTPFRDTNRTTGRDLNRLGGLAGRKDTYGNWWGGLGTEIATDPLTYLSLGGTAIGKGVGSLMAKSGIHGLEAARIASKAARAGKASGIGTAAVKAGKAAKYWDWVGPREARQLLTPRMVEEFAPDMFGILQSTAKAQKGGAFDLANHMDEPMGSLAKIWPLGDQGLIGRGGTAQKIARGLDVAGDFVRHARIPGTAIRPVGDLTNLVNAKAGKAVTPDDLQSAYRLHHLKEGARAESNLWTAKWTNDLIKSGHKNTDAFQVRDWFEFPQKAPPDVQPLVAEVRQYVDRLPQIAKELGVKIGDVNPRMQAAGSDAKYFMRQIAEGVTGTPRSGRPFDPATAAELARAPWTLGSKGGTKAIADMARDPLLERLITQGKNPQSAARYIKRKYGTNFPAQFLDQEQMGLLEGMGLPPTLANAAATGLSNPALKDKLLPHDTFKAAATQLKGMSPEVRKAGIYANHPLNDFVASITGTLDKVESSKVALERIAEAATTPGVGTVPVKEVLRKIGLDAGDGQTYGAAKWLQGKGLQNPLDAHIPKDTADFLTQMHEPFEGGPKTVHAMVQLYDDISNLTKMVFTNLDPIRFNVRNRVSGVVSNAMSPEQFMLKAQFDADHLVRGRVVEGAAQNPFIIEEAAKRGLQNINDQQATDILRELLYAHEVTGSYGVAALPHHHAQAGVGGQLEDIIQGIPGGHPFSFGQAVNKLKGQGTTWNPFKSSLRGVGGAEKTTFAPAAFGEDISHFTESMNRIAPFWALLQAGVHPSEAAQRVFSSQVAYQGRFYTKFEQQVLKRLFLFYSFSKGQVPFTLKQLMENPGGRMAQTLRGINRSKDQDELVPQHVSETPSIPLGTLPDGSKRYITGLGLGFEDPLQFAAPSAKNLGLEALSRANPLIKGPMEWVTGQSFFQRTPGGGGRELTELDPPLGRILANVREMAGGAPSTEGPVLYPGSGVIEHMLANSPVSNVLTKARTITDPRKKGLPGAAAKASNLLTGFKLSDVSPAAQDRELRNRVQRIEKLLGAKTFTETYLPKELKGKMSPAEQSQAAALNALKKLLDERSKTRNKTPRK